MFSVPDDPGWQISESPWEPERNQVWASLFTLGNGYLGVRGFPEEKFSAGPSLVGTYVAGVFDPAPDGIPELVNLPNCFAIRVMLGGRRMLLSRQRVSEYVRKLYLRQGMLVRSFVYTHPGRQTFIELERFTSIASPHIACQRLAITPLNWRGKVAVELLIDAGVKNQTCRHLRPVDQRPVEKNCVMVVTETKRTGIRIAQAFRAQGWVHQDAPPRPKHSKQKNRTGIRYEVELECGQQARFLRKIATCTSRDPDVKSLKRDTLKLLRSTRGVGYEAALRAHTAGWREKWDTCDVEVDGPVEDQLALRFAIFQLVQACSRFDTAVSIGAKALTGEGYRGHVFWDTEIFMLPFFIYTDPEAARRLLAYRYHTLGGARRKAKENGYAGAMFAWESADTGEETCPRHVPDPRTGEPVRVWTGEIEQHISADVVYGGWHYWQATGDEDFRRAVLTEIAVETARFWSTRVEYKGEFDRYEIRDVIGPDEYHEHVNNNAFTNYMAAWNLCLAVKLAELLEREDADAWERLSERLKLMPSDLQNWRQIAHKMYLPFDREANLFIQHGGFLKLADVDPGPLSVRVSQEPEKTRMPKIWKSQVLKQADILMLFMLWPDDFSKSVKRANWNYYEPRTTHDSSLSASVHSIVASQLRLKRKAYQYFRFSASTEFEDIFNNTDDGLHAAALGGTWQAVVRGFLGLRRAGETLRIEPCLPGNWQSLSCKLFHRGTLYHVHAAKDKVAVLPVSGSRPSWVQVGSVRRRLRLGRKSTFRHMRLHI